jgi:hypothetical protein
MLLGVLRHIVNGKRGTKFDRNGPLLDESHHAEAWKWRQKIGPSTRDARGRATLSKL